MRLLKFGEHSNPSFELQFFLVVVANLIRPKCRQNSHNKAPFSLLKLFSVSPPLKVGKKRHNLYSLARSAYTIWSRKNARSFVTFVAAKLFKIEGSGFLALFPERFFFFNLFHPSKPESYSRNLLYYTLQH